MRPDTIFPRDLGDVRRRFKSKTGHSGFGEVFEKVAVVAGDFDDETVFPQFFLRDMLLHSGTGVAQHGVGEGGKVDVVAEQIDGWHCVRDLHEPAVTTHEDRKREERFRFAKVFRAQQVVRQRLESEVDDRE